MTAVKRPIPWHALGLAAVALGALRVAAASYVGDHAWVTTLDPEMGRLAWLHPRWFAIAWLLIAAPIFAQAIIAWQGRPGSARRAALIIGVTGILLIRPATLGTPSAWLWAGAAWLVAAFIDTDKRLRAYDGADGWAASTVRVRLRRIWTPIVRTIGRPHAHHIGMVLVALGVALRIAAVAVMDIRADGATYTAMGHAWAQTGHFTMPWGEIAQWRAAGATPSHHYPPGYPFYLGLVYKVFGFGLLQTQMAALVMSLLAVAVVLLTTRDLYGRTVAWVATGLISVESQLLWSTGTNFSESLVMLLFALTMWGILKSLKDDRYIMVAGLAAGLAYLTRSSVGAFFIVAGTGGFLWRFLSMRWIVFRNKWYLIAIAMFLTCVASWTTRNIRTFGGWPHWDAPWQVGPAELLDRVTDGGHLWAYILAAWLVGGAVFYLGRPRPDTPGAARLSWPVYGSFMVAAFAGVAWLFAYANHQTALHGAPDWHTSSYITGAHERAWAEPAQVRLAMFYKAPFFGVLFLPIAAWFTPQLRASFKAIREEHESGLWLGVLLLSVIAWIIASLFQVAESGPMFWLDNRRYIIIAYVPLLWLMLRRVNWAMPSSRVRVIGAALVLLVGTVTTFVSPVEYSEDDAARALAPMLEAGDIIAYDIGMNKYSVYPWLAEGPVDTRDIRVTGYMQDEEPYDYIITVQKDKAYPGYNELGRWTTTYWHGGATTAVLYQRG